MMLLSSTTGSGRPLMIDACKTSQSAPDKRVRTSAAQAIRVSAPIKAPSSAPAPAASALRNAGSPTNSRNAKTPVSSNAAAKWIARTRTSVALKIPPCVSRRHLEGEVAFRRMGIDRHDSPDHFVGTGRKRVEGHAQKRTILRVHLHITLVHLCPALVHDLHCAEGGLELLGERKTQLAGWRAHRAADSRCRMIQRGMCDRWRGASPTQPKEQSGAR